MSTPRISLDQWRSLVAVVEAGGFAQAAEVLHKTQSTVSYGVRQIEERLGIEVFEIVGRKAVLTPAGQVLYRRGAALVEEAARLEKTAGNLAKGEEAELRLAVEVIFPTWLLLDRLREFSQTYPNMRVELHETVLAGADELLVGGHVDLAICGEVPPGFIGEPFMQVRFVAAAAPSHSLHQAGRTLGLDDLRDHCHIVIRDSGLARSREGAWQVSQRRLTVGNKATSIRAAVLGIGFAWFPEDNIREELEAGTLKPLPLREGADRWVPLHLVIADGEAAGPGTRHLAELLRQTIKQPIGRTPA